MRKRYIKSGEALVTAVQIELNVDGFSYQKWGGNQVCERGDWLVDNKGDCYTIKKDYFREHYQQVVPGRFKKVTPVWAEVAQQCGELPTAEGTTEYRAGDYLVFDREQGGVGYAVKKNEFERHYQEINQSDSATNGAESLDGDFLNREEERLKQYEEKKNAHHREYRKNHRIFFSAQMMAIVCAAMIPALNKFPGSSDSDLIIFVMSILGGLAATCTGLITTFKFHETAGLEKNKASRIKQLLEEYRIKLDEPDRKKRFKELEIKVAGLGD